jgi:succinate dehydrogenase / fumarate reductase cytochrome b subunit
MLLKNLLKTTIAQKILVALTGIFMIFFLIAHLLGNLEIFSGAEALNQYGVLLRTFPKVLWAFRVALLISLGLHVFLTIKLQKQNKDAKKITYEAVHFRKTTKASRIMLLSGLTILCFVIFHLAHFTLGVVDSNFENLVDEQGRHHVYNMVILGFSNPIVSGFYILAQVLLAFHISHGFASCFRTLGFSNPAIFNKIKTFSNMFALIIAALYISIPVCVLLKILPLSI